MNGERKHYILVVDNLPEHTSLFEQTLMPAYNLSFASDEEDALNILMSEDPFDLILLNSRIPGMDGCEVCNRLKGDKRTKDIPVIFITGNDADELKGLEIGAADYIRTPLNRAAINLRVRVQLELKRYRDIIENLICLDEVTGIPNRRRFEEIFDMEWRLGIREKTFLSLVLIDIDYFKKFNDEYFRRAGDDCLREVAKAILASVRRPMDFVARYSGQEFVAVLPRTDVKGTAIVAETMRSGVESLNIQHARSPIKNCVTVSAGVSTVTPSKDFSSAMLIKRAGEALAEAKKKGRNQVRTLNLCPSLPVVSPDFL
jgi:diguanylate cyclase (GGDEF)-like protein